MEKMFGVKWYDHYCDNCGTHVSSSSDPKPKPGIRIVVDNNGKEHEMGRCYNCKEAAVQPDTRKIAS